MSSVLQFVCGAAVGVGLFVAASRLRHGFLSGNFNNPTPGVEVITPERRATTQERARSIRSAVTPVRTNGDIGANSTEPDQPDDKTQNVLNVLYCIAEDQAIKEGYIHRGITCNTCQASPICGVRYKCGNCVDYDICERCESQDRHNRTHAFIKIRIPIPPLANPRTPCLPSLYPGNKSHPCQLSWEETRRLQDKSHFDQVEIEALIEQFKTLATEDLGITREVFDQCLGPLGQQSNLVMEQMFKFYDSNGDNIIDLEEFIQALSILVKGSQEEKIPHAFKGYDTEKKGYITKENLRQMFKAYFNVSLELVRDVVRSCEEEMMAAFDDAGDKPVSAVFNAPIPSDTEPSTSGKPNMHFHHPGSGRREEDGTWPVMEAMSQDAIDEMVEHVFAYADADKNGEISYEEFKVWATCDSTLLAWFEALGTVF
ncbi:uncharacterized protein LOC116601905 [Nematostella vectensis]|uniref:uncharacterized protein LOC116601905 n=1 Tax=Nematostella vectensis TaxID=45351 RepID=UPI00139060A2|nr:uncharacterized protein LOC116601905 [Nematostella vectensis]